MLESLDHLSKFDCFFIDDTHRRLAYRVLAWSLECSRDPNVEEHAGRAFFATTFGLLCAPRSARSEELFVSIKFLMIFFQIDDAPSSVMNEIVAPVSRREAGNDCGAAYDFQNCYVSLMSHFDGGRQEVKDFQSALRRICSSMQMEKSADKDAWSEQEMLEIRKVVVGIPAFSECWRAILGLVFAPPIESALKIHAPLDITCEIACLVNDIASFDRDEQTSRTDPANVDPNLVLLRMRKLGSREAALESGIQWYNRKVEEFRLAEQALLTGEHGHDPALRSYLEILHCAIVGDLATSKHLVPMRYEGSAPALARLLKLDDLSR